MNRPPRFVLCLVVGAIAALLCRTPPASAANQSVTIAHYAFGPTSLNVRVGDTVTWTNTDQAPHDVTTTASAPVPIHSPTLKIGMSWSYTFTTLGTYSYICSIHPDMRAMVVVQPTAPPTQPADQALPRRRTRRPGRSAACPLPVTRMPSARAAAPAPRKPMAASAPRSKAAVTMSPSTPVMPASSAAASGTQTSLDPLMLIVGLVAAIATFCLLLLGSRQDAAAPPPTPEAGQLRQ
jgi:plastocyanin